MDTNEEDRRRQRLGVQWNYHEIHRQNQQHVYLLGIVDAKTREPRFPEEAALGTAFAVSKEGHFLTAFHSVKDDFDDIRAGRRLLAVKGVHGYGVPSEPAVQVEVLDAFPKSDFLLLKSPVKRQAHVTLTAGHVPLGTLVATIGFPLSHYDEDTEKVEVGKRMVSAMVSAANDRGGVHEIEMDKHLAHGHSGGPVFGMGGTVVAMAKSYKRAWHRVTEASWIGGETVKTTKMLHLPTQFSTATLISNVADRLRHHGVPVFIDENRFPEAPEE